MRTCFIVFLLALQCCSQIQQQEIQSYGVDWSRGASAFRNLLMNSRTVEEATFSAIKSEQSPPLYYHYYEDGFLGERYVITDDTQVTPDGARLPELQGNDRIILHKVRCLAHHKKDVNFQIALIEFSNGKKRVFGEYLYLNSPKETGELLPEHLKDFASTTAIDQLFSVEKGK